MDFLQVVGSRRSIRWFKTWAQVPQEKIQRILEVARLTTSPGNLQPWRAVVVERDRLDQETRERLLAADNWQGAHTQAPVWIYWYGDPDSAVPQAFKEGVYQLMDGGALPPAYGWSPESVEATIERGEQAPEGMPGIHELVHGLPYEMSALVAAQETVGACAQATLAAVNEGLGTTLHMIATPSKQEEVKKLLGVPERCVPVWVQLVGYPAEDPEGGGQRPRRPFEDIFFHMQWGQPFRRDDNVVAALQEERAIQAPMPKPGRAEELKYLSRMYGYPE
jgi:nitroreductase